MRFKQRFLAAKSFATGKILYEGKRVAEVGDGTEVIDMGRGRYDVYGKLLDPMREIVRSPPLLLATIAETLLEYGYSALGTLGALPTILPEHGAQGDDRGGIWHRDAYSMWDQEALEVRLPWFYMTCILPLHDLELGEGGTEFVLGSHRMNLSELGLATAEEIEAWAARQPRMEAAIKAGSLCVFHGALLLSNASTMYCSVASKVTETTRCTNQSNLHACVCRRIDPASRCSYPRCTVNWPAQCVSYPNSRCAVFRF
jgi:hypothetical protein